MHEIVQVFRSIIIDDNHYDGLVNQHNMSGIYGATYKGIAKI